jgi:glycosyltransferase involved in cell wall biosynthesis
MIDKVLDLLRNIRCLLLKTAYSLKAEKDTKIVDIIADPERSTLLITHNWGGGTEQFERNVADAMVDKLYVLRIVSYRRNIYCKLENHGIGNHICKPSVMEKLLTLKFRKIIVNSLVSTSPAFETMDILKRYKKENPDVSFIYYVHDFHSVCPIYTLVADDWYCGLECSKHDCRFNLKDNRYSGSIESWRSHWNEFLLIFDEIICFSNSSREILYQAYPSLRGRNVEVKPHSMSYCNFQSIKEIDGFRLHIGIFGNIANVPKGELVVKRLLKELPENIPISFVGISENQIGVSRPNTYYHGRYALKELPEIIREHKISMALFPSICPETFSYLVSELMMLGIPIMCFDVGAQGEKVKAYDKGIICHDVDDMVAKIAEMSNRKLPNSALFQ